MSSHELVSSFEKLKKTAGEDSDESLHGFHQNLPQTNYIREVELHTLPHGSNSSQAVLKDFSYNDEHGPNFIDDADKAQIILLNVFPYLSRKDLLSAAWVCKLWNLIFWKRISLKNCFVRDLDMMVRSLKKYRTEILDLRGMFFLSSDGRCLDFRISRILQRKWSRLCQALTKVTTLTEITMERCPPEAITLLAEGAPQLKSLSANFRVTKVPNKLDINFLKNMKDLKTLKLKLSGEQLIFNKSSSEIADKIELNLKALTITGAMNPFYIEHILPTTLVSLELGNSHSFSNEFYNAGLPKLVNLARLRLEDCIDPFQVAIIVETVSKLPNLFELELVNFVIPDGFLSVFAECTNLKSLLLIPTYKIKQDLQALWNHEILEGINMLKNSLQVFVWVLPQNIVPILFVTNTGTEIRSLSFVQIQSDIQSYLKVKILKARNPSLASKHSLKNIKM